MTDCIVLCSSSLLTPVCSGRGIRGTAQIPQVHCGYTCTHSVQVPVNKDFGGFAACFLTWHLSIFLYFSSALQQILPWNARQYSSSCPFPIGYFLSICSGSRPLYLFMTSLLAVVVQPRCIFWVPWLSCSFEPNCYIAFFSVSTFTGLSLLRFYYIELCTFSRAVNCGFSCISSCVQSHFKIHMLLIDSNWC